MKKNPENPNSQSGLFGLRALLAIRATFSLPDNTPLHRFLRFLKHPGST